MTECKNQHYLPKFYFRLFSEKGVVEVYDLKDKVFHPGSCRDLCAEEWFYSRDAIIEKNFSALETVFSRILHKIIDNKDTNALTDKEYSCLLLFLVFQNARTAKGRELSDDLSNFLFQESSKELLRRNIGKKPWITEEFIRTHPMPTISGPSHAISLMHALNSSAVLISDLKPVILINNTGRDFIFSDSPVVLYNSFFNNKDGTSSTGLQAPGLQIFCPLNSKIMLMLYDSKFYNFKNFSNDTVNITLDSDIDALNTLQVFNCREWIFFIDKIQSTAIAAQYSLLENRINNDYYGIERYSIPDPSGLGRDFVIFYKKDIDYSLAGKLSFMVFNTAVGAVNPFGFRDNRLVQLAEQKSKNLKIYNEIGEVEHDEKI